MLKPWKPESPTEFGLMIDLNCKACTQHKKGGGRPDLGQNVCKLLWGGVKGTVANDHLRLAWGTDSTTDKLVCRMCRPKPLPKPRQLKPDAEIQTTMEFA